MPTFALNGAAGSPPFRLLAITPPEGPLDPNIVERWASASALGIGVLLRQPGLPLLALLSLVHRGRFAMLAERCRAEGLPLLLSLGVDDLDELAALSGAEGLRARTGLLISGVQLRGDPNAAQIEALRRALGPGRGWIGRSCHGAPQGEHERVDYTCFAPVFPPTTAQPGVVKTAVGLPALQSWTSEPGARVFALGGVGPASAGACLAAGAWGLAGIGLFFGDPMRVGEDVASVVQLVDRHLRDVRPLQQP